MFERLIHRPIRLTLLIGAVSLFYSCQQPDSANAAHDHELADWPARAQTVYSEHYQLFFENEYAVVGRATTLALHVSNLSDGSPRQAGSLEFSLNGSEANLNETIAHPTRPGIYLIQLTFEKPGSYSWSATIDSDKVELAPIVVHADEHSAIHAAEDAVESNSGITMLKEQQWPIRLLIEEVQRQSVVHQIPATARIAACKTHSAKVLSPVMGKLLAPQSGARIVLGQQVKAGDLLAMLQVPLLGDSLAAWKAAAAQATSEAARAAAELQQASASFERVQSLFAKQAKSQLQLEEAQYQYATAVAADQSARVISEIYIQAQPGSAMSLPLFAPISGQVITAATASGEWVSVAEALFEIQDLSQLHVSVRVPEADLPELSAPYLAHIPHPNNATRIALPGADGKLLLAAQKVNPLTHSAELLYEIPNPGWLRAGMTLTAQLSTGEAHDVMSVPWSSIVDDSGMSIAFVQTGGETFERRIVQLGHRDGERVEVLAGLELGERVVTDGAYVVHLTALSGAIPEHSH